MADGEYLESMRDDGRIAVIWEGFYGSVGWNLYDDIHHFLEWAEWQVQYFVKEVGLSEDTVAPLRSILKDESLQYGEKAKKYLQTSQDVSQGTTVQSKDRGPFTFKDLCEDEYLNEWFNEDRKVDNLPKMALCEDLKEAEDFIIGHYDEPGYWQP